MIHSFKIGWKKVARVKCHTLEEAYASTNHISHSWLDNKEVTPLVAEARSTSCGDVIADSKGKLYLVDTIGMKPLSRQGKAFYTTARAAAPSRPKETVRIERGTRLIWRGAAPNGTMVNDRLWNFALQHSRRMPKANFNGSHFVEVEKSIQLIIPIKQSEDERYVVLIEAAAEAKEAQ